MLKSLAVLALFGVTCAMCFASQLIGDFKWVQGTLTANLTITGNPQSVTLKVGSATTTYTNVYVTGTPASILDSGTPFTILENGSYPFDATMSIDSEMFSTGDGSGPAGVRTVPVSSAGVMSDSVGFQSYSYTTLTVLVPACTIGSYDFLNGVVANISAPLSSYSLYIPTSPTAPTVQKVTFPTGSTLPTDLTFEAAGTGTITFGGASVSNTCYVVGVIGGAGGTDYSAATLTITNGESL